MYTEDKFLIGVGDEGRVWLLPYMANRHGLIAGATGTGKTVTVKTIAESMSDAGIPTFIADVKSDVSGMMVPGEATEKLVERLRKLGIENYPFHGCPVRYWDVYGECGVPIRTTVKNMGPSLLSRLLDLTDAQSGVLNIAFRVAEDEGMELIDLKDLRAMINYLGENRQQYTVSYGNVATQTCGAIQRALLTLEDAGGDVFFGEPALDIKDWIQCTDSGRGYVNLLYAVKLFQSPLLYSTFMLWMLTELYNTLPEAGDLDKPKLCFFFDEAHLLFTDAPKALITKVEQVVKLIRSKGVGVYFITQNPADIPNSVLAQLGNRVQHALRAYTPTELKAVKAAADSFRTNPNFKTEDVITELGTGEALISFLDEKGRPGIVQRATVLACMCSMDAADEQVVFYNNATNPFMAKYKDVQDDETAYEVLNAAAEEKAAALQAEKEAKEAEKAAKEAEKQR
ncbi:MAG: DUF853 family protein, partial [Coriobacteriales bacterium]|nr:DUF853 family protein [Coriobacteriales bacterium]